MHDISLTLMLCLGGLCGTIITGARKRIAGSVRTVNSEGVVANEKLLQTKILSRKWLLADEPARQRSLHLFAQNLVPFPADASPGHLDPIWPPVGLATIFLGAKHVLLAMPF